MTGPKNPNGDAPQLGKRDRFARLQELFHELVDLHAAEREQRLSAIRDEDQNFYRDLAELLCGETSGGSPLGAGERALDRLAEEPDALLAGDDEPADAESEGKIADRIGPYRVIRILGEGGMGRVYEAEQTEPLVRRVAVKVLRHDAGPGVLTRFDAERRALAVMDHPNIARMLDAGATDDGKPWFAMELVDGMPVTRWAAQRNLDLDERIELLLPVCDAVQHAHLKGVIHRDLKPSNILVTEGDDGRPAPKVIDFGIAKAIEQPLLARTLATRFGELVGTPEYMSPEQAALGGVDIDTRSDIYALGLVLYELLVGELPLRPEELRGLAFDEICRRIREDETPRPSTLLATRSSRIAADSDGQESSPEATKASTRTWTRRLRRDLDAVLLKALAKDRERRYESAASFATDLRCFLRDEAVEAAAPSWSYRAGKFIRRHRAAVALTTLAALSLAIGLVLALSGMVQARAAEQRAAEQARIAEETTNFLVALFEESDPSRQPEDPTVRSLLDRAAENIEDDKDATPQVQANLLGTLAQVYANLGLRERTTAMRQQQVEVLDRLGTDLDIKTTTRTQLATALRVQGDLEQAQAEATKALEALKEAGLEDSLAAGRVFESLASTDWARGEFATARDHLLRSLELRTRHQDPDPGWRLRVLNHLAIMETELGQASEARKLYREALRIAEDLSGPVGPWQAKTLNNLGNLELQSDRYAEAATYHRQALEMRSGMLGESHPDTVESLNNLGTVLVAQKDYEQALTVLERAERASRESMGANHPRTLSARLKLADILRISGRHAEAEQRLQVLLPLFQESFGEEHPAVAQVYVALAKVELVNGRLAGAATWARNALQLRQEIYGEGHRETEKAREVMAEIDTAKAESDAGSR